MFYLTANVSNPTSGRLEAASLAPNVLPIVFALVKRLVADPSTLGVMCEPTRVS